MPYVHKFIALAQGKKAYEILLNSGFNMREAQRLIDKGRLLCEGAVVGEKNAVLNGAVNLIDYETRPRGLKPVFETADFAVFDKPSGVLSHPNGRHCEYSLNDEIWSLYGREAAVAHRLDFETSGLIVVARNKAAQVELKKTFENRAVQKIYVALVQGRVEPGGTGGEWISADELDLDMQGLASATNLLGVNAFDGGNLSGAIAKCDMDFAGGRGDKRSISAEIKTATAQANNDDMNLANHNKRLLKIDAAMDLADDYDDVKMRMKICENGKRAVTLIEPVKYFADIDATLVRAVPLTGRQHQIRLHLFHMKHKILGEPLYGLGREQIIQILDKKMSKDERINLTGAARLLLHASEIRFKFNGQIYAVKSNFDAQNEFYRLAKSAKI